MKKILSDDYTVKAFLAEEITAPVIKKAEKAAKGADFLIGVGGGRVIDTAKIVSFNLDLPFISVPTAASHDGIASARASVSFGTGHSSLEAQPPVAIIADTGIIASAPHRLLAAGCADIISNYTAILDWELAHRVKGEPMSEYAIALSKMTAEILVKNAHLIKPHQEESAWFVVKALVSSGVAMSIAARHARQAAGSTSFPMPWTSSRRVRLSMGRLRDRDDHLDVPPRRRLAGYPLVFKDDRGTGHTCRSRDRRCSCSRSPPDGKDYPSRALYHIRYGADTGIGRETRAPAVYGVRISWQIRRRK